MDWEKCLICQFDTSEVLRGKENGGCYETWSTLLPQFAKLGEFCLDKFGGQSSVWTGEISEVQEELKSIFIANKGCYHKKCVSDYNKTKLERAIKRSEKALKRPTLTIFDESGPSKRTRRHDEKIKFGESKCLFCVMVDDTANMCAAGTLHATDVKADKKHAVKFTE